MNNELIYEGTYNAINEEILDLEDMIDRMNTLNTISYDKNFHQQIIKRYNVILKKIMNDTLIKEDDKKLFVEIIKNLFETTNVTIDER